MRTPPARKRTRTALYVLGAATACLPAFLDAQDVEAIQTADSIRAVMAETRPPGEQPTDWVDVVGFPLKVALFPVDLVLVRLPALAAGQLTLPRPPGFVVRTIRTASDAGFPPIVRSSLGPNSGPALGLRVTRFDPFVAEGAVSLRGSQRYRIDTDFPIGRWSSGVGATWQRDAQVEFYGIGPDSPDRKALYRRESADVTAHATLRPGARLTLTSTVAYENDLVRAPIGAGDEESLSDVFEVERLFGATGRQEFARFGAAAMLDLTRAGEFQRRGVRILADATVFRGIGATEADFHQVGLEAQGLAPLNPRQLLALRIRAEGTRAERGDIPFYHLASIGGDDSAIGYPDRRFADRNAATAIAEWRYEVWRDIHNQARVETFLYFGESAVGPSLSRIESEDWHASYGFGFRAVSREGLLGLVYLGFSEENVRFGFSGEWLP